jgi:hypothetical protein
MLARRGSSDPMSLVVALGFVAFLFIIAIIQSIIDEKRRKAIKDYCFKHGLRYSEVAGEIPSVAYHFSLLAEKGHTNKWQTEMAGERGDFSFTIFEHYYVTGYGKNRHTYIDTICVVSKPGVNMPQFFIRDEHMIIDSLGKLFGGQDINFTEDPTFSKEFVLQGMIEHDIRKFFNRKVRAAFVNKRTVGYQYEGCLDCFATRISGTLNIEGRLLMLSNVMKIFREIATTNLDGNENNYLS